MPGRAAGRPGTDPATAVSPPRRRLRVPAARSLTRRVAPDHGPVGRAGAAHGPVGRASAGPGSVGGAAAGQAPVGRGVVGRAVAVWLVVGLLVAGCAAEPGPRAASPSHVPSPAPSSTVSTPAPAPTSPAATASPGKPRRADDIDGDGLADLLIETRSKDWLPIHTVFLGSRRGLDPGERVDATSRTSCSLRFLRDNWAADLDGDGYSDRLGAEQVDAGRSRPCVVWGPHNSAPGKIATPLRITGHVGAENAVVGDIDGDGAADIAMPASPEGSFFTTDLLVLYGPFSRDGTPARRSVQPSPSGDEFRTLIVGRIGEASGLIVREPDDGEQTSNWLLRAGPDGLERTGRKLNEGLAGAYGDFDGDGAADVAIGDDGSRNDEPGYETEPPSVHRRLTVYYGKGRTETFGGTAGTIAAGDFDGDGYDDLAFGGTREYSPVEPLLIFRGGPGGLSRAGRLGGVGETRPWTTGDFDGDGDDELVLVRGQDDEVEVLVSDGERILSRFTV